MTTTDVEKKLVTTAACHSTGLLGGGLGVYGSMWPSASSAREGGTPFRDLLGDFAEQAEEM